MWTPSCVAPTFFFLGGGSDTAAACSCATCGREQRREPLK